MIFLGAARKPEEIAPTKKVEKGPRTSKSTKSVRSDDEVECRSLRSSAQQEELRSKFKDVKPVGTVDKKEKAERDRAKSPRSESKKEIDAKKGIPTGPEPSKQALGVKEEDKLERRTAQEDKPDQKDKKEIAKAIPSKAEGDKVKPEKDIVAKKTREELSDKLDKGIAPGTEKSAAARDRAEKAPFGIKDLGKRGVGEEEYPITPEEKKQMMKKVPIKDDAAITAARKEVSPREVKDREPKYEGNNILNSNDKPREL